MDGASQELVSTHAIVKRRWCWCWHWHLYCAHYTTEQNRTEAMFTLYPSIYPGKTNTEHVYTWLSDLYGLVGEFSSFGILSGWRAGERAVDVTPPALLVF